MHTRLFGLAFVIAVLLVAASPAEAILVGTVPIAPGGATPVGLVPDGAPAGVLLATIVSPWAFGGPGGVTSGLLRSAVYMEAGGTLDFYYQIVNDPSSVSAITGETSFNFGEVFTAVGYRLDGSSLPGGIFLDGFVLPVSAGRDATGDVVGLSFTPPILPSFTSNVFVISTDATQYTAGGASVLDGGSFTVTAFQPVGEAPVVPEPVSFLLLGAGTAILAVRSRWARRC